MTAEIAIMNKMAIALAADSAVTLSAGAKEEKIFDSADKLFELSDANPIGIMIYSGASFMQVPLPILIRKFRSRCAAVERVGELASQFLEFLHEFGKDAPDNVRRSVIASIVEPFASFLAERIIGDFQERLYAQGGPPADAKAVHEEITNDYIGLAVRIVSRAADLKFVGEGPLAVDAEADEEIGRKFAEHLPWTNDDMKARLLEVGRMLLRKESPFSGGTGIVIAGFGSQDLFPKLVSYEIDGVICNRLRYAEKQSVDIDRGGPRAAILPFAQKEMVDRFLYGLDDEIQRRITTVCKQTVPTIKLEIAKQLAFDNSAARSDWMARVGELEDAFVKGIDELAFTKIRDGSRSEIEGMVEFMPKPELAKMAEALVNLTSIKRRISRGMETVGGPIDVAVISQSEGFVWIKRKHYFPPELNLRYQSRVGETLARRESNHGSVQELGRDLRRGAGKSGKIKKAKPVKRAAASRGSDTEGDA